MEINDSDVLAAGRLVENAVLGLVSIAKRHVMLGTKAVKDEYEKALDGIKAAEKSLDVLIADYTKDRTPEKKAPAKKSKGK